MTRFKKLHTYPAGSLRDSALGGTAATALCGRTRVVTPEDIDAVKDLDLPLCPKCGDALAAMSKDSDVLIRERTGWEQFEKDTRPVRVFSYSVTISANGKVTEWPGQVGS